jgi:antitoxin ParD1/3/4
MDKNTTITLGNHSQDFVEDQGTQDRYNSVKDALRGGLYLLEDQETKPAGLRAALHAGEESGAATAFDFETFIAAKRGHSSSGS